MKIAPKKSSYLLFFFYCSKEMPPITLWIAFIIGLVHCFLPMEKLNQMIFQIQKAEDNTQTYEEA